MFDQQNYSLHRNKIYPELLALFCTNKIFDDYFFSRFLDKKKKDINAAISIKNTY